MQRRVLIAGCGYVGTALGESLAQRGHSVFGARRTPGVIAPGVASVTVDVTAPLEPSSLPDAIDTVVYAVAADSRDESDYRRAYVTGVENLLATLRRRRDPIRRFVLLSSTGVYGQTDGRWVDEDTPTESRGTGAILEEGERTALAAEVPAVVLRLGGIYGPGRLSLIDRVRAGAAGCPAGAPQYTNRMHRDDIVAAVEHILDLPTPAPLYLGVDDEPADTATVVRWLAAELAAPEPKTVPAEPGRPNKRCRNRLLRASGFALRFPTFREGYRDILRNDRPI